MAAELDLRIRPETRYYDNKKILKRIANRIIGDLRGWEERELSTISGVTLFCQAEAVRAQWSGLQTNHGLVTPQALILANYENYSSGSSYLRSSCCLSVCPL